MYFFGVVLFFSAIFLANILQNSEDKRLSARGAIQELMSVVQYVILQNVVYTDD